MPETDPAAVRGRTELITRGWPEYLHWQPDADRLAELEQLCTACRGAQRYPWKAVTDPAPPEVARTYEALRVALVEAGLPERLAEFAADATSLDWLDIVGCVWWTAIPKPPGWTP